MALKSRKIYVWLISLLAVLLIYLLVNRLYETPEIEIEKADELAGITGQFDSNVGRVGDVGVGKVNFAVFKDTNREFGFEKLLHKEGSEWELEKPFMVFYRPKFKCFINAARGKVQVETSAGKTTPKDATLSENVVIHIVPEPGSSVKETFIYLDSLVFISDRSQISTTGPVKLVSEDAQMLGKGMELIYNNQAYRLEYLKIFHLDSLLLRTSGPSFLPPPRTDSDSHIDTAARVEATSPDLPVASDDSQKAELSPKSAQPAKQAAGQSDVQYYSSLFRKNVLVNGPEYLIFADELAINNISDKTNETETVSTDKGGPSTAPAQDTTTHLDPGQAQSKTTPAKPQKPPENLPEQPVDIIVTCDDGIIVTPMDKTPKKAAELDAVSTVTGGRGLKNFGDPNGRATLDARRIDYCSISEEVLLQGDCLGTMRETDQNIKAERNLSAQKIFVKLSKDDKQTASPAPGIEHVTASGGVVQLDTSKYAGEKLLGFTKLKCLQFDFDSNEQVFSAAGPGAIAVDNSRITDSKPKANKFSLQKQCVAVVRNFDTLRYFIQENRVIADAGNEQILIDYFPVEQGRYGQQITATASHIEALLYETAEGKNELSTLRASGGISYAEKGIDFEGDKLFYDANKSLITAWSDGSQPCFLNGVQVDGIKYNLKSGRAAEAQIVGPGGLVYGR